MMRLLDVNILVSAFWQEAPDHSAIRAWLAESVSGSDAVLIPHQVLPAFIRVVTGPRFAHPEQFEQAFAFCQRLLDAPAVRLHAAGMGFWTIFQDLCIRGRATGNAVPDAALAAMALDAGAELVTCDMGFSRFPGLRWRHPLDSQPRFNPT